jgi:F-type H+-transporting ATPase subunit delta
MAERTTIARPYADAAFETAREQNALAQWSESLKLAETIAGDAQMADALASPRLDAADKAALFLSIAGDRFPADMRNFVRILIDADRLDVLSEIRALFEARKRDAEGVATATIVSAAPLSDAQVAELTGALAKRFGKRIEATVSVDPSLIGGARIAVGDTVIDGSVRSKLAAMAQALSA